MEKINETRKDLSKLKNNKNEFNYSLLSEINGNFDWVNQLFLEMSETVIDLEKDPSLFKKDEIEIVKKLRIILTEEDDKMRCEKEKRNNIPVRQIISKDCQYPEIVDKKVMKNKTGNTRQKYKLGHLVDYEIENSKYLSKSFKLKNDKIVGYLYSIDIFKIIKYQGEKKEEGMMTDPIQESSNFLNQNKIEFKSDAITKFMHNEKSFGILSPFPLCDYIKFPILKPISMREKKYNVEYVSIEFMKKNNFSREAFIELTRFHHTFFADMYSYKEIECPQLERFLGKDSEERKYLIIPIKREKPSNKWIINTKKIRQSQEFMNKKIIGESIKSIIDNEFCKIGKSTGITREAAEKTIISKISEKLFYSTYKFQLFEIGEIFYAEEASRIFLYKGNQLFYTIVAEYHNNRCNIMDIKKRNIDEIVSVLLSKYFGNISMEDLNSSSTADIIINNFSQVESINKFRKLVETISKNHDNLMAFAYGVPLKTINHFDFTYNNSSNLKHSIHSQKKLKKKYDKDASLYSIFPISHLNTHFLSRKIYKLATKLPTILSKFERYILPFEMCNKYKINLKPEMNRKDISFTFDKLKIFLHATTAPGAMEDYNFESLETLGDSILKFILSLRLFIDYEDDTEGELQKKRTELLKNDKLHEIGLNSEIYKYILNQPFKVQNWEPPLKREMKQIFGQNVTKKCMADSVEAIIGACFLVERNLSSSLNFMKRLKIIDNSLKKEKADKRSSGIVLEDLICVNSISIELTEKYSFCSKENVTFFQLYQLNQIFNLRVIGNVMNDYVPFTHPLIDPDFDKKIISSNINLLQKLINYKFKDLSLLILAFTHPSYKNSIYDSNYQRLEFLGDSVLEVYLMIKFFVLFEHKLFSFTEDNLNGIGSDMKSNLINIQNFNCGSLTHAKSLLASNYFLIKLSSMLNLQKFLMISDKNKREQIKSFYNKENIESILKQKSNEYETDPNNCLKPKIISDIFEALLGAILIDSNLEECFKFLDSIYYPFILYSAIFLDSVKYSPISQFTEMSMKLYQIAPKFIKTEIQNKLISVEIWLNDKLFSKGAAMSEDRAKEIAAIEGITKIKTSE